MRRIAVTGHRSLPRNVERAVDGRLRTYLELQAPDLIGLSCLADGADSLFAAAVLDLGGVLEVVVPAASYRDRLPAAHRDRYDAFLARASLVHHLPHPVSDSDSHMAAGRYLVDHSEEVVAVWDGLPARGHGGTADVVGYARERGRPVMVIWPAGARR